VTCGSLQLESSYQRVKRCAYISTSLYEYRGYNAKKARDKHRHYTWGLRHLEVKSFHLSLHFWKVVHSFVPIRFLVIWVLCIFIGVCSKTAKLLYFHILLHSVTFFFSCHVLILLFQRYAVEFYLSDCETGLRVLVKAGHNAHVIPDVEENTVLDINAKLTSLPIDFLNWLNDRNLSADDRIMRLKEGYYY